MPGLACLTFADCHGSGIGVKVGDLEANQLAVSTARQQSALHDIAERPVTGIDQSAAFIDGEEANDRSIDLAERLHLSPRIVARNVALLEGVVERRLENGQDPVGG